MKVVVVGPGAMGCLMAASLALKADFSDNSINGNSLWLLDHKKERATAIAQHGIILEEDDREYNCHVHASADPEQIGKADIIFLCVKSQDVGSFLSQFQSLLKAETLLITLQNGIGHIPILQKIAQSNNVAIGVTAQGATLKGIGRVRHAGYGLTRIGYMAPQTGDAMVILNRAAVLLTRSGITTEVVDSVMDHVWAKLLVNVGINALTAILGCQNGKLLDTHSSKAQLVDAVQEAETVARAIGINIKEDPVAMTCKICQATRLNFSSMLQDVQNKRPTEIDSINGAVVKKAKELGILVPVNEKLVQAVKAIEKKY